MSLRLCEDCGMRSDICLELGGCQERNDREYAESEELKRQEQTEARRDHWLHDAYDRKGGR